MKKIDTTREICNSILLKFGAEEHVKALQNGLVYMNKLEYFINLEEKESDKHASDLLEGKFKNKVKNAFMTITPENSEVSTKTSFDGEIIIDANVKNRLVYCMFHLDINDNTELTQEDEKTVIEYQFTKEQQENFPKFGDSVLVIYNVPEFIRRIEANMNKIGHSIIHGLVEYNYSDTRYVLNEMSKYKDYLAFNKREQYSYQNEYRILSTKDSGSDHLELEIGSLKDISTMVKTKDLFQYDGVVQIVCHSKI